MAYSWRIWMGTTQTQKVKNRSKENKIYGMSFFLMFHMLGHHWEVVGWNRHYGSNRRLFVGRLHGRNSLELNHIGCGKANRFPGFPSKTSLKKQTKKVYNYRSSSRCWAAFCAFKASSSSRFCFSSWSFRVTNMSSCSDFFVCKLISCWRLTAWICWLASVFFIKKKIPKNKGYR